MDVPAFDGPRRARGDEFTDLLDLVDRCFRQRRGGMADRLPFVYDASQPDRHAIIRQDGRIVAHVAAIPETLVVGEGEVACVGIGGVATDPKYREAGHMSELLEFWLDQLDAPLFELGGDRTRYGRFGWENAGQEFHYRLTDRSLPDIEPNSAVTTYDGAVEQRRRVRDLHAEEPYRVRRGIEETAQVLARKDTETLLTSGTAAAYLSVDRTSSEAAIREFGGAASGIKTLLAAAFERFVFDAAIVSCPPSHPLNATFRRLSGSWEQTPCRKLNVRDLAVTLRGFAGQMSRRLVESPLSEETVTLGIEGTDDRVRLHYDGAALSIDPHDGAPAVALDRRELVLLLFGNRGHMPEVRDRHPLLDVVCPLRFYIWQSERV